MTKERIVKLKTIGFVFCTRKRPRMSDEQERLHLSEDEYGGKGRDGDLFSEDEGSDTRPQVVNGSGNNRAAQARFPWDRYQLHSPFTR